MIKENNTPKYGKILISNYKFNAYKAFYLFLMVISVFVSFVIILDNDRPYYYNSLFLLPIAYIFMLLINASNIMKCFKNFGVLLIFALEFVRLVMAPLFLTFSNYIELITYNVEQNTPKAIMLLVYEAIIIAIAVKLPTKTKREYKTDYKRGVATLNKFMALYTLILAIICALAPEILLAHRTFLGVFTDKSFTSMTLDSVIDLYPTGLKHYLLMISRLLLIPYRLLLPAYLIIILNHYFKRRFMILSWIISLFPFLMVNDVIAQSIYYTMFLLLLNCYLYRVNRRTIIFVISLSVIAVLIYFLGRDLLSSESNVSGLINSFATRLFTYFSGVNIVAGSFNLPDNLPNKFQYIAYDFLKAIPFNKTLLGLDSTVASATLFNSSNFCDYQIPTTIGMCSYYFGFIFAPVYSFILARLSKRSGLMLQDSRIPLLRLVKMFCAFIFALGLVMYNVEIVCNTIVQVVLPIYIIIKLSFRRNKSDT